MSFVKHPLVFIGIIVLTLLLGWQLGRDSLPPTTGGQWMENSSASVGAATLQRETDMSLFWTAWQALNESYIHPDKLETEKLVYGAISGLVGSLEDPYTVFLTPQENTDFRSVLFGQLQGIGAELDLENGLIIVITPLRGSPAEKAGLLPGDNVTAVNGDPVDGKTLNDVVHAIRGPKGTVVTLTILRGEERKELEIQIIRDDIKIPSVEASLEQTEHGAVGLITLNQFGDATTTEFAEALSALMPKNPVGLVIDLRSNGGGYLDGATEIAQFFVPKDTLVVTVERRDGESEQHRTELRALVPDLPIVVLVNQGTASAAEILAGALQDHKRATIVGMKTFGKGTVQDVIDLPGGSSIKVTTARWLTPSGRDIGTEKVEPDVEVDRTAEDFVAERDPQLQAAYALFGTTPPLERDDELGG